MTMRKVYIALKSNRLVLRYVKSIIIVMKLLVKLLEFFACVQRKFFSNGLLFRHSRAMSYFER